MIALLRRTRWLCVPALLVCSAGCPTPKPAAVAHRPATGAPRSAARTPGHPHPASRPAARARQRATHRPRPARAQLVPGFGPDWPRILLGTESRYFSSFDRRGGNHDGFDGRHATLYRLPGGEHVIFDALGPGVLRTLWFTGPREGGEGFDLGQLRFYFDGETKPRIAIDALKLFRGEQPPFTTPLVADNRVSTGGYVSWVPLAYRRRLVITTEKKPSFYIAQYDTLPRGVELDSYSASTDLSAVTRLFSEAARCPSRGAAKPAPLDYHHRGTGTVELIRFRPRDAAKLEGARVQITWDGARKPAIDLPLLEFFGSGLGAAPVRALAFCIGDSVFESRWPMPFWRGFHLQITGAQGKLALRIGPPRFSPKRAGHLHAHRVAPARTKRGRDFVWLDRQGSGKLVGTLLTVRPPSPQTKRWWEGDLRSEVDGRRTPGLHGTGHEDDHLGGWSNTFLSHPFSLPMHGEPRSVLIETTGVQYNARVTLYRLWPGIHFAGRIRHSVEHGNQNRVQARYGGVAWFYLQPGGARLRDSDRLVLGDRASERAHRFTVEGDVTRARLTSAFEGRRYRRRHRATVVHHTGPATMVLRAPPENRGCFLRRVYDQRKGRQRARVLVDGRSAGDWYIAESNRWLRWAERDLFVPASLTRHKARLKVELRPVDGAPAWTASEYRLLCISER